MVKRTPSCATPRTRTQKRTKPGAEEEFERLKLKLPNVKFGLLHGQLSSEEKQTALDLLPWAKRSVSSPLPWWVGVDVPNVPHRHRRFRWRRLRWFRSRRFTPTPWPRRSRLSTISMLPLKYTNPDEDPRPALAASLSLKKPTTHPALSNRLQLRGAGDLWGSKQSGNSVELFHASLATDLYLLESVKSCRGTRRLGEVERMNPSLCPRPFSSRLRKEPLSM